MKNKKVKYFTPKVSLELITIEDHVCNGSIVVNHANAQPQVNDWDVGDGDPIGGGYYDL